MDTLNASGPKRHYDGEWRKGYSGNPSGRPKGAKDQARRFRFEKKRDWDCAKNLGDYAIHGGPGRPKGSRNRSKSELSAKDALREKLQGDFPNTKTRDFKRVVNAGLV